MSLWVGVTEEPKFIENFNNNKIIWMYWEQGGLPSRSVNEIKCVEEWKNLNPEWTVRLLDYNKACELVPDLSKVKRTVQIRSDYLRIQLLLKYGGVWADVTLYPIIPLKNWLYHEFENNNGLVFYSFKNILSKRPNHRKIASWFMAAQDINNPIMQKIVNKFKNTVMSSSKKLTYYILHNDITHLIDTDKTIHNWWKNIKLDAVQVFNKAPKTLPFDKLPKSQYMFKKPWKQY